MNKFNLGDKVYYIERDWYLEKAVKHYGNEYTNYNFTKPNTYLPFEVLSIKHIKTKDIYSNEITESFAYDLCYMENNHADIREDIKEEDIFSSFKECCLQVISVTENTRWR